jgi:acyl-CoA thioesterase
MTEYSTRPEITDMVDHEDVAPKFKEAMIAKAKEKIPYWKLLGMEVVDMKKGWAKIRVPFSRKLTNANGKLHGGVIFSAADSATAIAVVGAVSRDAFLTTIEMKINYLKPIDDGEIIAEAKIIHQGSQTAIGDIEVKDATGELVAKALSTYAIVKK